MEQFKNSPLGLYDVATGESVKADKVIDVSKWCPVAEQVIVKYANVEAGRIAQITDLYEHGKDLGASVHYHINTMTATELAKDSVFEKFAYGVGAEPFVLANEIYTNK